MTSTLPSADWGGKIGIFAPKRQLIRIFAPKRPHFFQKRPKTSKNVHFASGVNTKGVMGELDRSTPLGNFPHLFSISARRSGPYSSVFRPALLNHFTPIKRNKATNNHTHPHKNMSLSQSQFPHNPTLPPKPHPPPSPHCPHLLLRIGVGQIRTDSDGFGQISDRFRTDSDEITDTFGFSADDFGFPSESVRFPSIFVSFSYRSPIVLLLSSHCLPIFS